jgi:hypothetical protein
MRIAGSTYFNMMAEVSKFNAQHSTNGQSDAGTDPLLPPTDNTPEGQTPTAPHSHTPGASHSPIGAHGSHQKPPSNDASGESGEGKDDPFNSPQNPHRGKWINETA